MRRGLLVDEVGPTVEPQPGERAELFTEPIGRVRPCKPGGSVQDRASGIASTSGPARSLTSGERCSSNGSARLCRHHGADGGLRAALCLGRRSGRPRRVHPSRQARQDRSLGPRSQQRPCAPDPGPAHSALSHCDDRVVPPEQPIRSRCGDDDDFRRVPRCCRSCRWR